MLTFGGLTRHVALLSLVIIIHGKARMEFVQEKSATETGFEPSTFESRDQCSNHYTTDASAWVEFNTVAMPIVFLHQQQDTALTATFFMTTRIYQVESIPEKTR